MPYCREGIPSVTPNDRHTDFRTEKTVEMNNSEKKIKAKSYTLVEENGGWLAQVTLTSDGMFAAVSNYGNMSFAWRAFGNDFIGFLVDLDIDYFATKLYSGNNYIAYGKKYERAAQRFARKILPPLQEVLKKETIGGLGW